jgi:uncharacterized delta-60 repeat protein
MFLAPRSACRHALLGALLCAAAIVLAVGAAAARAASPGTLDPSFGSGGVALSGAGMRLFGTAAQSDGKVVAVGESLGSSPDVVAARFTASGALDSSFGSGGVAHGPAIGGSVGRGVAIQSDGKIVVVGSATDSSGNYTHGLVVERFNSNGSLDTGFGSGGVVQQLGGISAGQGNAVAVQPDGKIVATGAASVAGSSGTFPRVAVVRLNANGSLDGGFRGGGVDVLDLGAFSYALAVALQPNGAIVIAGSQAPGLQVPNALIARLTPSGALDTSFAGAGAYAHQYARGASNSAFNAVAIQPNGAIVAAGAATDGNTSADTFAVRFTSSGAQDGSFGSGGVVYAPSANNYSAGAGAVPGGYGMTLAPNGDAVVAGFYQNSANTYAAVWAFTSHGALDGSFGSHGTAVYTNTAGNNTEYAAIAISPTNGGLVTAGDAGPPYSGSYSGIAARYIGFGTPKPPPPPAFKLSLAGVKRVYKTSTVAKKGLKLIAGCNQACSVTASLTVSAATARKLHLKVHGRRPVTIASARATLRAAGGRTITLRLSKGNARALAKQKLVGLTVQLAGTASATHRKKTTKKGVIFKR